ncbi:MAG: TetR family transcriptional regulator [Chloroflexi bacterium]|jgi:AcrR family transcriptional regulator|nr:TetR family transcriptional regulator [Chloroflexota bacterium]
MPDESDARTSRWDRHKERTRRRLLNEAERLFRTQGFDETTVEEIAEAADVAKGTFFNYFQSKNSILGAILYASTQPLLVEPPGAGAPADERIRLLMTALWEALAPYHHIARRMMSQAMAHPPQKPEPEPYLTPARTLTELIREGQAQGRFRAEIDAEMAGSFVATYFFRLFLRGCFTDELDDLSWDTIVEEGLDLLYHGLMISSAKGQAEDAAT